MIYIKAESAKNDLKGLWKTIKVASNLLVATSRNFMDDLDEENLN